MKWENQPHLQKSWEDSMILPNHSVHTEDAFEVVRQTRRLTVCEKVRRQTKLLELIERLNSRRNFQILSRMMHTLTHTRLADKLDM